MYPRYKILCKRINNFIKFKISLKNSFITLVTYVNYSITLIFLFPSFQVIFNGLAIGQTLLSLISN